MSWLKRLFAPIEEKPWDRRAAMAALRWRWRCECGAHSRQDYTEGDADLNAMRHWIRQPLPHPMPEVYEVKEDEDATDAARA